MKNSKKTYTLVAILVAVVALGIGYAAVTTLLEITGTANVLQSDGVELNFTGTPTATGGESGSAASIDSDPTKAVCTAVLKDYNDSVVCTYTIKNVSTDTSLSATSLAIAAYEDSSYTTAWSASSSDYFTITTAVNASSLANNATTTATVTVTLKKENITNANIVENFYVKVTGDTSQGS